METLISDIIKNNGSPPIVRKSDDSLLVYLNENYTMEICIDTYNIKLIFCQQSIRNDVVKAFDTQEQWVECIINMLKFFDVTKSIDVGCLR